MVRTLLSFFVRPQKVFELESSNFLAFLTITCFSLFYTSAEKAVDFDNKQKFDSKQNFDNKLNFYYEQNFDNEQNLITNTNLITTKKFYNE